MNGKILIEAEVNNLLEAQKYLRLDGENQMVSNLQMNGHKIVNMADAVSATDGVNKKVLDNAVNFLARDLTTESQRYTDNLILQTNENRGAEIEKLRFRLDMETFRVDSVGSAMQSLNMNQQSISNLLQPVESDNAVRKSYVDDFFINGTSNRISIINFKIINLVEPTESRDATTKHCVDQLFNDLREMINRGDS